MFKARSVFVIFLVVLTACNGSSLSTANTSAPSPSSYSAVTISENQIEYAISKVDDIAQDLMQKTGLPGMSIAVAHNDKLIYAKGFGVRELGKYPKVDENTVFQLASLSKPIILSK